jgi:hypothetical protein
MDNLKPVNVAGATIVVQVCLLTIIGLGIAFENNSESIIELRHNLKQRAYGLTLVLAILSIVAVALSTDFYQVWSPLLGDVSLPTLSRSSAFMVVFMLDIIAVICLVEWTGGSRSSQFTSMLFLIPALAIFLREPPAKFLTYAAVVSVYYYFTCIDRGRYKMPLGWTVDGALQSHRIVNLGCLGLAMLTGYITRPVAL